MSNRAPKVKGINSVLLRKPLLIWPSYFHCPWCNRSWERGGSKEGFVKSGANNHVDACYEARLYLLGYIRGSYNEKTNDQVALPVSSLDGSQPWHKRVHRGIKANLAKRRRDGVQWAIDAACRSPLPAQSLE